MKIQRYKDYTEFKRHGSSYIPLQYVKLLLFLSPLLYYIKCNEHICVRK